MKRLAALSGSVLFALFALSACRGGSQSFLPQHATRTKQSADAYATAVLADGPTAYYRLDNTTSAVLDSSPNGLNGTAGASVSENAAGLVQSSTDTAMAFPGTASTAGTVNVSQTTLLQPANAVTLEAWLRFATAPANYTVAVAYGSDASYSPYDLYFSGGHIVAQFDTSAGPVIATSPAVLSANTTYYVAGTFDGTTARLYVNGSQVASTAKSGTLTNYINGYGLTIGADPSFSDPAFNGTIDEVAVYAGKALSAASIQNHYNVAVQASPSPAPSPTPSPTPTPTPASYENVVLGDAPLQYFRLAESTGPTALDSSTTGVNGTYIGSVTYGAPGPLLNESSNAIALPGGTQSVGVSLPNPNAVSGTSYSIETWVYPNPSSSFMTIWGYSGARRLLLNSQGLLLTQFNGNFMSHNALSRGQWHDVVFVYNAPAATQSLYIDGTLDNSASLSNTAAAFTSSYYLGQYDTGVYYKWNGKIAQHAFFKSALTSAQVAQLYSAAGYGAAPVPTPSAAPAFTDWSTFGDSLQRINYNPNETTLSAANAPNLKLAWRANLGAAVTAQPLVATNVPIGGVPTTVLYVGTEGGVFYALNATTGATIWSQPLGTVTTGCMQTPHGVSGITGTATYDKGLNRIYVADGKNRLHALDMSTGAESSGWPIVIESSFTINHIYSALSLNPDNGLLYVETASMCDAPTWHGRIDAVNPSSASIVASFFPGGKYNGAGIWGTGGAGIDQSTDNVYVATGNDAAGESGAYGDHVVRLSSTLALLGSNFPNITGSDEDFGATPMLYRPNACPELFVVKNKSGMLFTYDATLAAGPLQSLAMAPVTATGQFIGTTAYSPSQNLVYVGDPRGNSTYTHGLIALAPQSDCSLAPAWQQTTGPAAPTADDNNEATVANGVVYFTDGVGDQAFAFDAASGAQLWNSGSIIGGPVMVAPTVDGELYVSSWDGHLYAFAP